MRYCLFVIFLISSLSNIAQTTTITVDKDYDADPFLVTEHVKYLYGLPGGVNHPEVEGTLRFACAKANKIIGSCIIDFDPTLYLHTINITWGTLPLISGSGTLLTGITIDGTATQIKIDLNNNGLSIFSFNHLDNILIKGIGFKNYTVHTAYARIAISLRFCNNVNILNNQFVDGDSGIEIFPATNITIDNNIFSNILSLGLSIANYGLNISENITISNNQFSASTQSKMGILIMGSRDVLISQNYFNFLFFGIRIQGSSRIQVLNSTSTIPFMNNIGGLSARAIFLEGLQANNGKTSPHIVSVLNGIINGTCENFDRVQIFKSVGGPQDADWYVGEIYDTDGDGVWQLTGLNNTIDDCFVAIATGNDPTTNKYHCSSQLSNKVCFTSIPCNVLISNLILQDDLCGNNGGEIHVASTGGVLPVSYVLSGIDCQGISISSTTNLTGDFTGLGVGTYSVVATDANGCSISQSNIIIKTSVPVSYHLNVTDNTLCQGEPTEISCVVHENPVPECINYYLPNTTSCSWNFGANAYPPTSTNCGSNIVSFSTAGDHVIQLNVSGSCTSYILTNTIAVGGENCVTCTDCIGTFAPTPGEKYIVSAWVKEKIMDAITYEYASIMLSYIDANGNQIGYDQLFAKGRIIDGWQKMEEEITIPALTKDFKVELKNNYVNSNPPVETYFDDIRIQPVKSNMKTYVYDPITGKLSAILDENNYATFYEYDEEGNLIRVKKETERGINTIQETRQNIHLNNP